MTFSAPVAGVGAFAGGEGLRARCAAATMAGDSSRPAIIQASSRQRHASNFFLSLITYHLSLFIKPAVVGGVTQHALHVAARFGERNRLDPFFNVEATALGNPPLGAARPGVV